MQIGERTFFLRKVEVPYKEPTGDLWEIAKTEPHCYKWHHYYDRYEGLFAGLRDRPIKILEIGVYFGGSVKMWSRYFHPDSTIVGVDIEERVRAYEGGNIHIRVGAQENVDFLKSVVDEFGKFDVIIDDGSHMSHHQRGTWQYMFMHGLKDEGGIYVVEDTYNSYFPDMLGPYQQPFIGVAAKAVTLMHMNYIEAECTQPFIHDDPSGFSVPMEDLEAYIKEIAFSDGQVVFRKGLRSAPVAPPFNHDALKPEEHGID